MVGHWFVRRIDMAMAIYSVALSVGFMIAFPVVGSLVQSHGWRAAWFAIGAAILAVLVPLALLLVRRSPESIGLTADCTRPRIPRTSSGPIERRTHPEPELEPPGYTLGRGAATPAFWVFAIGSALYGLVASGIGLFNESILAERGFGPDIYYQTLVVTAMTGLAGNFVGGWLARTVPLDRLMAISLSLLALGLLALPHIATITMAMAWAVLMGLGGGLVMVLFFSVWPRVYGRRQLGPHPGRRAVDDRARFGDRTAAARGVCGNDRQLRRDVLHARGRGRRRRGRGFFDNHAEVHHNRSISCVIQPPYANADA